MVDENIDNYFLISLVKRKPVLWDNTTPLFKNRVATQTAWKEIMMILKPQYESSSERTRQSFVKLMIHRWNHIKDNYYRSFKIIEEQKRLGVKSVKPYVYSNRLGFLNKVMPSSETCSELHNTGSKNLRNDSQTKNTSEINPKETNTIETNNPIPKRVLKEPMDEYANILGAKMIKFMDSYSSNKHRILNRHLSFFNGILPTVDNFDDDEVLEFQIGVLQLMKKIKNSRQNQKSFNDIYGGPSSIHEEFIEENRFDFQENDFSGTVNATSTTNMTPLEYTIARFESPHTESEGVAPSENAFTESDDIIKVENDFEPC